MASRKFLLQVTSVSRWFEISRRISVRGRVQMGSLTICNFHRKVQECFNRGDFAASRYKWVYMQACWLFSWTMGMSKCLLADFSKTTAKLVAHARLGILFLDIASQDFLAGEDEAKCLLEWCEENIDLCSDLAEPLSIAKVHLCRLPSLTASPGYWPKFERGILNLAVASLRRSTFFANKKFNALQKELRWGINNCLIKLGCRHRCGRAKLACVQVKVVVTER
jgi:hypothetical protein